MSPFLCPLPECELIFLPLSFESTAIIPLWHAALMNAFQPSLLCFSASHYQSVELISLLTAWAIMRLLSLMIGHFQFLHYSCCFFPQQRHLFSVDSVVCLMKWYVHWLRHLHVHFNQFSHCKPCLQWDFWLQTLPISLLRDFWCLTLVLVCEYLFTYLHILFPTNTILNMILFILDYGLTNEYRRKMIKYKKKRVFFLVGFWRTGT